MNVAVTVTVNGKTYQNEVEPRLLLVHYLRDVLGLTGTHVGCDTSQCGACTIIMDGAAVKSCTILTVQADGANLETIEGLAKGDELHPVQTAFIKYDGFQCGYCTPGQICSAVGLLEEARRGEVSHVTPDVSVTTTRLTDDEMRERMSGNICRCGAYPGIVAAIREVQSGRETAQTWHFATDEEIAAAMNEEGRNDATV
jgi:xanthine dehydrogenase YagT iron-sulfur-binding subunit